MKPLAPPRDFPTAPTRSSQCESWGLSRSDSGSPSTATLKSVSGFSAGYSVIRQAVQTRCCAVAVADLVEDVADCVVAEKTQAVLSGVVCLVKSGWFDEC